jgi:hypothetical protein
MKTIAIAFKISTVVGLLVGLVMCCVGWQHNPQCEFHCEGFVDWVALFILWGSWFVTVGVIGGAFMSLLLYIFNLARSGKNA